LLLVGAAGAGDPRPVGARHNVVLVTLDTTRADHLGCYGWPQAHTPNLDALARRGTRFARCDTAAPITLPSHASILTGIYPPRHGVRDNGTYNLPDRIETVASRLQAAGYDTGAVVSAVVLARRYGLDRGFRLYDDDLGGAASGLEASERTADATTLQALAVAARLRPPFFLWVHYFDPHEGYRPPARIADAITGPHRLYDGEIAYVDEQLGKLLGQLPRDADLAVVADHGEMLGEHGELTHGLLLYQGVRRVPLLLAGPDVPAGQVVECLVRTVDLAPTLLGWGGVAAPAGLDGASLLPLPSGASCDRPSYVESLLPFLAYRWYPPRALSDGHSLYLRGAQPSLYALATDPGEERDLALAEPQVTASWEERLRALVAGMGESLEPEVRPETAPADDERERLASLGYVSGGGGGRVSSRLPDARAMTLVAQRLHHAVELAQQSKCAEALPEVEKMLAADPHNFPALSLAGECLRDTGRHEAALGYFRRAAHENPRSAVPLASAGDSLLRLGRGDEAMAQYRLSLALDPTQAQPATSLARLLRDRHNTTEALRVLDAAIAAGGHAPMLFLEQGLALAESNRVKDALASFLEAARRNPADPVSRENAAKAVYLLGGFAESAELYEDLLRLVPDRVDLWRTLAAIYMLELDDKPRAARAYREALRLEPDPSERAKLEMLLRALGG
jgi:choline-sulfatase